MSNESVLLAIHDRLGSFSDRWIERCEAEGIPYKQVNCCDTTIIRQLDGVDELMWNWNHGLGEELLVARQMIAAAESAGIDTVGAGRNRDEARRILIHKVGDTRNTPMC